LRLSKSNLRSIAYNLKSDQPYKTIAMSVIAAKWSIDEYHQMISSRILENRRVKLLYPDLKIFN